MTTNYDPYIGMDKRDVDTYAIIDKKWPGDQGNLDSYNSATGKDFDVFKGDRPVILVPPKPYDYDVPDPVLEKEVVEGIVNFEKQDVIDAYFGEPDAGAVYSIIAAPPSFQYDADDHARLRDVRDELAIRVKELEDRLQRVRGELAMATYEVNQYENEHDL